MTIKRVEPLSFAKVAGAVYALVGLLIGAAVSAISLLGLAFAGQRPELQSSALSPVIGMFIGVGSIVVFPLIYGVMGFVFSLIGALVYNLVASKVGGIQIEVG